MTQANNHVRVAEPIRSAISKQSDPIRPLSWKRRAPKTSAFVLMHVACLGIFLVGVSLPALLLCVALYAIRMFGLTAGYHRYFSHHTFKTSRFVQFLLAILGSMAL